MNADSEKKKIWVSLNRLETLCIKMSFLHSKNMYKLVSSIERIIKTYSYDEDIWIYFSIWKLVVKFMI